MYPLCACVMASALLVPIGAAAQTLTYARDDVASAAGARAIATADFDGNGSLDIATANTGRITILLNDRNNGLARAVDIPVGLGPFDLAAGDFNRDAVPDLAVANADSESITVLLGKGDGSFTRRADIATPAENPRGIAAADVNHDGRLDLIYSGYAAQSLQVLTGNGAGGFARGVRLVGAATLPQGVAAADFNHDGHLDIAVAHASSGGLHVMFGNGGSAFTDRAIAGSSHLNVLATGDLNGDGWEDIAAVSTSASSVAIFAGSATGFTPPQTYSTGASPRGVALADVNQDGGLDVVTANRGSSTVSVLLADRAHPGRFLPGAQFAAGPGSRAVVAADFDADGKVDLVTGNEYSGAVTFLANTTQFTRAAYVLRQQPLTPGGDHFSQYGQHVWTADFNRDGKEDVAMARSLVDDEPWELSILLTGVGKVPLPQSGYPLALVVADINGDGNADVVYHAADAALRADIGDGRGGFTASAPTVSVFFPGNLRGMTTGDLNRDGRQDVVMVGYDPTTGDSSLRELFGDGRGSFRAATPIPLESPFANAIASVVDLNRDGKPDVAALFVNDGFTGQDVLRVWFGDGNGGLSAPAVTPIGEGFSEQINFDDVDRNGHLDAVVVGEGGVSVALGSAGGLGAPVLTSRATLCAAVPFGYETCWGGSKASTLADIDADGALDIITAGGDFVHGGGDGTFGPSSSFDYNGVDAAVIDMTRDGLPDIVSISSLGAVDLVVNQRNDVNQPPAVSAGPDRTIQYQQQTGSGELCFAHEAIGRDPDLHAVALEWREANGDLVSRERAFFACGKLPGTYEYRLKGDDLRGGVVNDSVLLTLAPVREIVLHVVEPPAEYGSARQWSPVADPTAADSVRAYNANANRPKVTAPRADPGDNFLLLRFAADPTQTYKLWLRLKADNNSWTNDSVWVQFSGASDTAGTPKYRIGTTSGLPVNLEECANCGVSGWGWEDDGWGAVNRNGVLLRFPQGGEQLMLIQTREDGVSVDQVVLSAQKYLAVRPGTAKNDTTILPPTDTR